MGHGGLRSAGVGPLTDLYRTLYAYADELAARVDDGWQPVIE